MVSAHWQGWQYERAHVLVWRLSEQGRDSIHISTIRNYCNDADEVAICIIKAGKVLDVKGKPSLREHRAMSRARKSGVA